MYGNVFNDNVFDINKFKVGDKFLFLCEYYIDPEDNNAKLLPLALYDAESRLLGSPLRVDSYKRVITRKNIALDHSLGIWEIQAVKNNNDENRVFLLSFFKSEFILNEINIISESFGSIFEFVKYLQSEGIPSRQFELYSHDFFLKPNSIISEQGVNSLRLKRTDFVENGNAYILNKKLEKVVGYELERGKNYENYEDEHGQVVSIYKYTNVTEEGKIVKTQSDDEVCVNSIAKYLECIYKNKNKAAKNYVKAFSSFLQDFTFQNSSILELVSKTGLSQENLLNKIGELKSFFENGQSPFDELLIRKIVDNNENIRKDFLSIVAKKYESELQSYKDDIQKERAILTAKQEEKSKLEQEILEIEQRKSFLIQFEDSFTSSFESKLDELKKSVPEALSAVMFNRSILSAGTNSIIAENKTQTPFVKDCFLTDKSNIEAEIDSFSTLLKCARNRFSQLNVKSALYSDVLISLLCSCDKLHFNLILCGAYSELIAHMYSFMVYGAKAAVLDCANPYDSTVQHTIELLKSKVIVVKNPFESNWIDKLATISVSSDKFFILTHPFVEDLTIEPSSVYSYFFPLFTKKFIDFTKPKLCANDVFENIKPTLYFSAESEFEENIDSTSKTSQISLELDFVLRTLSSENSDKYNLLANTVKSNFSQMQSNDFISLLMVPLLFATGKISEQQLNRIDSQKDPLKELNEILGFDND